MALRTFERCIHQHLAGRDDASSNNDCFEIQKIDQIGARDAEIVPRFFENINCSGVAC